MNIGYISDTRFLPTRNDSKGHGMGRFNAMICEGLAAKGHSVTLYARTGSYAKGCTVIETELDEVAFAEKLLKIESTHDIWIDGSHLFTFASKTTKPVLCRSCDREAKPPRNAVYTTLAHAHWIHKDYGIENLENVTVVHDGFDVNKYPFNAGKRFENLIAASNANAAYYKRPDFSFEVAKKVGLPLFICGIGYTGVPAPHLGALEPQRFFKVLSKSKALIHMAVACSGAATITEANATGTPVLTLADHDILQESMEHELTGFCVPASTPLKLVEYVERLQEIKPQDCRDWVDEKRNYFNMIDQYEALLLKVLDGEEI